MLDNSNKQKKTEITPSFGGNGPPCPSLEKHLPLLAMGELWLNGRMEERESEWLERKMVSRHSLQQHNNMERRDELRVTPPLYLYLFSRLLGF